MERVSSLIRHIPKVLKKDITEYGCLINKGLSDTLLLLIKKAWDFGNYEHYSKLLESSKRAEHARILEEKGEVEAAIYYKDSGLEKLDQCRAKWEKEPQLPPEDSLKRA